MEIMTCIDMDPGAKNRGRPRLAPPGETKAVNTVFNRRLLKKFDEWRWQADARERGEVIRRTMAWYLARPDQAQKLRQTPIQHGGLRAETGSKKRADLVHLRLLVSHELLAEMDAWCRSQHCNRSEGLRRIITFAIAQPVMPPEIAITHGKAN